MNFILPLATLGLFLYVVSCERRLLRHRKRIERLLVMTRQTVDTLREQMDRNDQLLAQIDDLQAQLENRQAPKRNVHH